MTQLQFAFDIGQTIDPFDNTITICEYCGRDWGNNTLYDINCHYNRYASYNGMCGTEFWIARREGKV
jgi:hypothetical protein